MPDSDSQITLSYVLVTYNKLPYLKDALTKLLAHKKADEEIVIVDGGSKDGTPAYLKELFERGDVDLYVSEPDKSLGHAINKGLLMARGTLIKTMSDDDIYYWDEMQKCKMFMLEHPEIDALGTNGTDQFGQEYRREEDFLMWKKGPYHPFMIAELGLMLRRSSIALFGLADTSFFFWDGEFTIRLTAGKSRIAWYTGKTWEHPLNEDSVSNTRSELWRKESARLRIMYPNLYSNWRHLVPKPIRTFIRYLKPKKKLVAPEVVSEPTFLF
jgi:glycosyltransferase involved in cell wall biosynthesis